MRMIFIFLLLSFNSLASSHSTYLEFEYVIKNKDTLSKIMKRFFTNYSKRDIENILLKNPHIKNWKKLIPHRKIVMFVKEEKANIIAIKNNIEKLNNEEKNVLEKKLEKTLTQHEKLSFWKLYYSKSETSGTEVLPEDIESSVETSISLGVESVLYFNVIYPLKLNTKAVYKKYRDIKLINQTNPSTTYTEVPLPSTWNYSMRLTKEGLWGDLGLYVGGERDVLYNPEFQTLLDRNILRKNELTWFHFGGEYPIDLNKYKLSLSASWGIPLLIETSLFDPIGNKEFDNSESELELSGSRQAFIGEIFYKNYFLNLALITTRFTGDKNITYSEIKSEIGISF